MDMPIAEANVADAHDAHAARLDRLAQVAVHVGLGLRPGQEVVLTAPFDAMPLVRRITEHCYRAGSPLVTTTPYSAAKTS